MITIEHLEAKRRKYTLEKARIDGAIQALDELIKTMQNSERFEVIMKSRCAGMTSPEPDPKVQNSERFSALEALRAEPNPRVREWLERHKFDDPTRPDVLSWIDREHNAARDVWIERDAHIGGMTPPAPHQIQPLFTAPNDEQTDEGTDKP